MIGLGSFLLFLLAALLAATGAEAKPLVVILADRAGTEVTDLFTPYAILAESGAVEVKVVSATTERVRLMPGMGWLKPQMTLDALARERPEGPDVVIVPALEIVDDPARSAWLREQMKSGARIMSICNGAKVLAAAGLLDGREATVNWYSQRKLARKYPKVTWRRDARWVTDGPITTTAGISASIPASLQLLRELAGETVMEETAHRLHLQMPDQSHDGKDFRLTIRGASLVVANKLAFWRHEDVAVPLSPGFDELAFGAALDGWSRTYRSTAWAAGAPSATSRHGLVVYSAETLPAEFDREAALPGANAMVTTFNRIGGAYGEPTARFVALQFEHPYGAISAR
jgi:putative intracellular protease/amidase